MSELDAMYLFREQLSDLLIADIVGPAGGEEEVIDDAPITRYVAGILYPAGGGWQHAGIVDAAQNDDEDDGYDEAVTPDPAVAMANVKNPASMGLTFSVREGSCQRLVLDIQAARYVALTEEP